MSQSIRLSYDVSGGDFVSAGQASEDVKRTLKNIGIPASVIRKIAIAMYEGEINMVIHANGGTAEIEIFEDKILIVLRDTGNGIADIGKAMQEGFSTATDAIRELGFGAGMGLPNMKKYSDDLKVESTVGVGTSVYLTFHLNNE
jgi:anti-sigma regulatory factor (Ser/Thr protein kinase)